MMSAPAAVMRSAWATAASTGLAPAIPMYVRFKVRDQPIVGTTLEYFSFRGLELAEGRQMTVLGEAVLGSRAAERLGGEAKDECWYVLEAEPGSEIYLGLRPEVDAASHNGH